MNEQRILFKKASYLMDNEIFSHVKTKKGIFFNGMIRKIDYPELILLEDRFLGELPIYFEEIENIEPFKVGGKE